MRLVADIGGTNTRLAFSCSGDVQVETTRSYLNEDFATFDDLLTQFLSSTPMHPNELVLAMAGPVLGNQGRLTNLDWVIDGVVLSARFSGQPVRVINDLAALGYASHRLSPRQLVSIAPAPCPQTAPKQALVVGIGTGFNLSPVIEDQGHILCPAMEAGHSSLPQPIRSALNQMKPELAQQFPTVESLFSGRGQQRFVSLLSGTDGHSAVTVAEEAADSGRPDFARDAYAGLIGSLIAGLKVAYLPTHGIYLAGGVARSSLAGKRSQICKTASERRDAPVKISPPIWVIDDDTAALTGCAAIRSVSG